MFQRWCLRSLHSGAAAAVHLKNHPKFIRLTESRHTLVGPPLPPLEANPAEHPRPRDPFMDLMEASFNAPSERLPLMGYTENNSPTYLSSGNPCLDFFFHVVPDTPSETVEELLAAAWERDAATALKLVAHLRGVRGTGKSDREGFYAAALWLHNHHPKTLALNVATLAEFGYMKDLLEILYRLVDGVDTPSRAKRNRNYEFTGGNPFRKLAYRRNFTRENAVRRTKEERIADELAKVKIVVENAAKLRHQKRAELARRALERYRRDHDYRFLHDRIADFFADLLVSDVEELKAGRVNNIGLAAKWCPSLYSSFDRVTLLCESIARRLFPRESHQDYSEIEEAHYTYRVRERLRKEVLVPLRKALQLPEVYISAQRWNELPYQRVASVAMKKYKEIFFEHDRERFQAYLSKVREGTEKIAAGALLPHELVSSAYEGEDDEVAELQWRRMVSDLLEKGNLKNCIAVCDVSGSMEGIPMKVCIALGMLLSELCEEPWKGRVITFSANPQLHKIEGERLVDKASFLTSLDWGMNTDFQKVFDQILKVGIEGNLAPEKMIKRIFVFSDMEFDEASGSNSWETDYQVICEKFKEKGYGKAIPEIVFWNLRNSRSTPVTQNEKGVALVSGFSKNLMKMFINREAEFTPLLIMEAAISGKEYQKLVVFD